MFGVIARRTARGRATALTRASAIIARHNSTEANSGGGGGGFITALGIAALAGGGVAYDRAYGPLARPEETWKQWLDRRAEHYAHALSNGGFSQEYKQDVFFSYERRLRAFSPPEKVFDYFASIHRDGNTYMTLSDLVRSLLPLHPAVGSGEMRAGKLHGEIDGGAESGKKMSTELMKSPLFELFDTDNNRLFDFAEYLFFMTLLKTDRKHATSTFHKYDVDGSGALDVDEFHAMMRDMRTQVKHATGIRTGLDTGVNSLDKVGDGLLDYLFGPKRNKKLNLKQFHAFLHDLRWEMDRLEFKHYDHDNVGSITPRDFGYSLVAGSKVDHLATFLQKVRQLPGDEVKQRVSRADFLAFARIAKHGDGAFQTEMKEISDSGAPITREKFRKLAKRTAGVKLSREVVDIVFSVFDVDGDDTLSYDEFFNAIITWK
jgi:Ca2+-binding EF-hand superfamily protein